VSYLGGGRATLNTTRSDTTDADVALSLAAARHLRHRPELADRNERSVFSAISQLLEALGSALARDGSSVPEPVRAAALRLARRLLGVTDQHPAGTDSRTDSDSARASRQSDRVPVISSIALGRMGRMG
jgi:hypothetical protein